MQQENYEFQTKLNLLRQLLDRYGADAVLLRRVSSFAWATCGAASYVNTASSEGAATLIVTREHTYLATNNIEAPRLQAEEHLNDQGWEFVISPWETPMQGLQSLVSGRSLLSDVPFNSAQEISAEISRLRTHLMPAEAERFRQLGKLCAEAMTSAAMAVRPGLSEFELAALLGGETQKRGVQSIVNLIATDERIFQFRHPLPTEKRLDKYAMLVLSGRRWGLVCSITRLIHFGHVPADIQRRVQATAQVNTALIAASIPGRSLGEALERGKQAYADAGFPDEWRHHHQGGITGYEPRECLAVTGSDEQIAENMALAWNSSVPGAKTEDTFLAGQDGHDNLTYTPAWPMLVVELPDQKIIQCAFALEL